MPKPLTIEEIERKHDQKVNLLRNSTIYKELDEESQQEEFGYRVRKENETFKVVDFGNIKTFYRLQIQKLLEEIVPPFQTFPEHQSDDFDEGFQACRLELLDNIKKAGFLIK